MPELNIHSLFGKSRAYFISIANYESDLITNLSTPHNDVIKLKGVLQHNHGFNCDGIPCDAQGADRSYLNPLFDADGNTVIDFLSKITCDREDRLIIYFAGHGIAQSSMGDPEGYFVPHNAVPGNWDTYVKMSSVMEILTRLECKHLLVILDCCFAGAFRWSDHMRGPGLEVPKTIYYERFQQYASDNAWQVITSSAHDQQSIDAIFGKREIQTVNQQLSPFATLLVKALENGEADLEYGNTPADGVITATELGFYLRNEICQYLFDCKIPIDKRQIPMLFPLNKHGKGEFIFTMPKANGFVSLENLSKDENPYKGLFAYGVKDGNLFYGRQRVLDGWEQDGITYEGLKEIVKKYSFVIVTGPSGSGKSSLVKAGILSLYDENKVHLLTPGKNPFSLHGTMLARLKSIEKGDIIFVDQYEELITVCTDANERKNFVNALHDLTQNNKVIITVRADFENHFRNSVLFNLPEDKSKRFVVPQFTREELREVIVQPAMLHVMEFKPVKQVAGESERFINTIIDEAFQSQGSLPLLSLAMSELFVKRDNRNLLEWEYKKFNGITGIIDQKANEEYNRNSSEQKLFRELIYRMVAWKGSERAKRRIYTDLGTAAARPITHPADGTIDELIFSDKKKTVAIKAIADRLCEARLLNTGSDENNVKFVEPAHDALLRSCSLVDEWLSEKRSVSGATEASKIQMVRMISEVSALYHNSEKSADYLWVTDPRLAQALDIKDLLNDVELKFVEESKREKDSQKRKRTQRLRGTIAAVILVLAGGFFLWSIYRTASATNTANELIAESKNHAPAEKIRLLEYASMLVPDNDEYKQSLTELFAEFDATLSFAAHRIRLSSPVTDYFVFEDVQNILISNDDSGAALIDIHGKPLLEFAGGISFGVSPDHRLFWINEAAKSRYSIYNNNGKLLAVIDGYSTLNPSFTSNNIFLLTDLDEFSEFGSKIIAFNESTNTFDSTILEKPMEINPFTTLPVEYDNKSKQFILSKGNEGGTQTLIANLQGRITNTYQGDLKAFFSHNGSILINTSERFELIELATGKKSIFKPKKGLPEYTGMFNGNKLYFASQKNIYEWSENSVRTIALNSTLPIEGNNFLCVLRDSLIFFYFHPSLYKVDLTTGNTDSIYLGFGGGSNEFFTKPSISESTERILCKFDKECIVVDLAQFSTKRISSGNLFPQFLSKNGDSILTISPDRSQLNAIVLKPNAGNLPWENDRSISELGSLPQENLLYLKSGLAYFVLNPATDEISPIDQQKILKQIARHHEINRHQRIRDSILFFGPDDQVKSLKYPKLPERLRQVFVSFKNQYALLSLYDKTLLMMDFEQKLHTIPVDTTFSVLHAVLSKDSIYIFQRNANGDFENLVFSPHNRQLLKKRPMDLSGKKGIPHFHRLFNDSIFFQTQRENFWITDVHGQQRGAIKFTRAIKSAKYVSANQIMVSLKAEAGQEIQKHFFVDNTGRILDSVNTFALSNAVFESHSGNIYYANFTEVGKLHTFTSIQKRLHYDTSILPLPPYLVKKYKLRSRARQGAARE